MQFGIKYRPSYSLLGVKLDPKEQILVEAGSMVSMAADMQIDTKLSATGGMFKALLGAIGKKFLGGETMFVNIFTASQAGGQIMIAPSLNGDIIHFPMQGGAIIIQASSFLASVPSIDLKLKFGGLKSLLGGEGLFLLRASGAGDLFINAYGGIRELDLNGPFIVDTGHIVAFEESLTFNVKKVGGWKSTLLSGEGLVCEFNGKGKLWIQTRNVGAMVSWLRPMLPA
ncbi:MAG TPA: TIGR00266 family protein [bacterium]|nr:TIGR00266 family protein [bacterium]